MARSATNLSSSQRVLQKEYRKRLLQVIDFYSILRPPIFLKSLWRLFKMSSSFHLVTLATISVSNVETAAINVYKLKFTKTFFPPFSCPNY